MNFTDSDRPARISPLGWGLPLIGMALAQLLRRVWLNGAYPQWPVHHLPLFFLCTLAAGLITLLTGLVVTWIGIVDINGGLFTYTLDDPYIHLELARHIAAGHYGLNQGEFTSPSSSILWPLVLAAFGDASWTQYLPLALNTLCAALTVLIVARMLTQSLCRNGTVASLALAITVMLVLVLATNMIGLVYTGLEHSAHVLAVAAVAAGLADLMQRARVSPLLVAGIVAGPLFRYEGAAISGAAILILFVNHRRALAVTLAAVLVALVGGYSWFLTSLDLHVLPNSILAKTLAGSSAKPVELSDAIGNVAATPGFNSRVLLLVMCVVLFTLAKRRRRGVPALLALPMLAHLTAGRYEWLNRYEMYILAWALLTLVLLHAEIEGLLAARSKRFYVAASVVLTLWAILLVQLGTRIAVLPVAASDVFEQHYLMSELARGHAAPVAVNDIGLVAYRSEHFVLDLWGLASNEALRNRMHGTDIEWIDASARRHGVTLAMVYRKWFPVLPASWVEVGELRLSHEPVAASDAVVTVLAVDDAAIASVRASLEKLQRRYPYLVYPFPVAAASPRD